MTDVEAQAVIAYIRILIKGRMDVERLTMREVGALSKVAAPTVCRFLGGRAIDAITFLKFADWLKADRVEAIPGTLARALTYGESARTTKPQE